MDTDNHRLITSETYGAQLVARGSSVLLTQSEPGEDPSSYYVAWSDGALNRHDTLAEAYADLRDGCENWAEAARDALDYDEALFWDAAAAKYANLANELAR